MTQNRLEIAIGMEKFFGQGKFETLKFVEDIHCNEYL